MVKTRELLVHLHLQAKLSAHQGKLRVGLVLGLSRPRPKVGILEGLDVELGDKDEALLEDVDSLGGGIPGGVVPGDVSSSGMGG